MCMVKMIVSKLLSGQGKCDSRLRSEVAPRTDAERVRAALGGIHDAAVAASGWASMYIARAYNDWATVSHARFD